MINNNEINNVNNNNNVLPEARLNLPAVIAEPVVNVPEAAKLYDEVILVNNGNNTQLDDPVFGLLLNSINRLILDIDNIKSKQYCSLMEILKRQLQKSNFIQKEKTRLNDQYFFIKNQLLTVTPPSNPNTYLQLNLSTYHPLTQKYLPHSEDLVYQNVNNV